MRRLKLEQNHYFGLPNLNYADWKKEGQLFVKLVLSVWLFIFILSTVKIFIPEEKFKQLILPPKSEHWDMKDYPLEKKPGLME